MTDKQGPDGLLMGLEAGPLNEEALSGENLAPGEAIPVIGIGASAGGLEVFRQLLGNLAGVTGFAYVVVQHLDPTHQSMLPEILGRATSMPVTEAVDGIRLEADHVYVIPANIDLTMASARTLRLTPRTETPGMHMPIDRFLRSLAEQCGSRAIGIILSGTGSDGSAGVEAIKAAGGVTFAQDAASAKFGAMPKAAVATDCVDFVLPPEGIAAEVVRISRHPYVAGPQREPEVVGGQNEFGEILAILHAATGVDFSQYREKMIKRRILRRLALLNYRSLGEYSKRLKNDSGERTALQRDLLISVTSFFRDPESFESLKKIAFPRILQRRPEQDPIRIWVAGCATGEEAFTIAILLQEYLNETGSRFPVQIFASDISTEAIDKARAGRYPENIAADITPERLNRYFTKLENGYQVNKNTRDMCVFTRHNLIDDPPFSKLDLISCRNVLIYLGNVQKNIIPLFHYALKPAGLLMLGASETAASGELFSEESREHRIFAKRDAAKKPLLFPTASHMTRRKEPVGSASAPQAPVLWDGIDMRQEVDRILLSKYSLAGVVVDEDLEVIEIRGKTSPYLTLPAGKLSFNLVKLIPDTGLFLEVEKLIQEAMKSGELAVREPVHYDDAGSSIDLKIQAIPLNSSPRRTALVLFEPVQEAEVPAVEPRDSRPANDLRDREISRLKQQLADAKERFLSAIEAHQTSREESQNTTEEALSANEELQSLNEELETAKEELQSTNEELITVNEELQAKNLELVQARDFAMSIVETVRQPLVVLDLELRVKMANRAFCRTFLVSPEEVQGHIVYSLSRGAWNLPGLRDSLENLLNARSSFPDFEAEQDFPGVGRRTVVLGGCRINHLKLLLVAVEDITERKAAQQALQLSEEHVRQSQKMEAVGRLAGGIAHDFNNLLTVIIGYSNLLGDILTGNEPAIRQVTEIKTAGERAASLTQQLLAFSRRQVLQPKVLDLNSIVADFERMLHRLVGERIKVVINCEPALWRVMVDPGEIGRTIMNLSLNARDAMPLGGTLTIETANVFLKGEAAARQELAPGQYVSMSVGDTGVGMDAETQLHIFEPFFTTKEVGSGTGLGLATVLGIIEQSGGVVRCESEPGRGTTFTILLPATAEGADHHGSRSAGMRLAETPKGTEVILLVEDDDVVRKLTNVILSKRGYVVLEAPNGRDGLTLCQSYKGRIDLLVTDVMMPEMSGRELAESVAALRPDMKIMFMSGHTEDVVLKEGVRKGAVFLQKPFTPVMLAHKVREVLDAKAPRSAGQP